MRNSNKSITDKINNTIKSLKQKSQTKRGQKKICKKMFTSYIQCELKQK